MGYPQPNSNNPVLQQSLDFFRLKTIIASSGDMYETEQTSQFVAIGPDSDIARANVAYYDPNNGPSFLSTAEISNRRGMNGSLYSQNVGGGLYQPSGRQGRTLLYPVDIWDPNYLPTGFSGGDTIFRYNPIFDIIQYFRQPPSFETARSDRLYTLQTGPAGRGNNWLIFPCYGRSWMMIQFTNQWVDPTTFEVRGVNFTIETGSPALLSPQDQETSLIASASYNQGLGVSKVINSSVGEFDALAVNITTTVGAPIIALKILMSDYGR